jgi:hypothetical protein
MWQTQWFHPGRVMTTPGVGAVLDQFDGPTQVRLVIGLLVRHITVTGARSTVTTRPPTITR